MRYHRCETGGRCYRAAICPRLDSRVRAVWSRRSQVSQLRRSCRLVCACCCFPPSLQPTDEVPTATLSSTPRLSSDGSLHTTLHTLHPLLSARGLHKHCFDSSSELAGLLVFPAPQLFVTLDRRWPLARRARSASQPLAPFSPHTNKLAVHPRCARPTSVV